VSPEPGQVFRRIERPDSLCVVLSSADDNRRTGWVTVCVYSLTGMIVNLPATRHLHSLTPSPGFITWTIHQSVPASALTEPVGVVETSALAAARASMEARFN
jgi:mRNA-degrading endonuclease toxin of MazEF toxin-antitoxin module